jgi:hypothetical protein
MLPPTNTANWIRLGLLALPLYGLLTFFASLHPQPDPSKDYEAWARFVTTDWYVLNHLFGSALGLICAIFGVFALGAYLANGRAGRLGLVAMVITVTATALFLMLMGVSAFAAPAQGAAYLADIEGGVDQVDPGLADEAQAATMLVMIVLLLVGNVLVGIAVWRSEMLPKWAGAIWVASAILLYPLGLIVGILITGNSPPTEPLGGLLILISGGWIAWSAIRQPSTQVGASKVQPRVK